MIRFYDSVAALRADAITHKVDFSRNHDDEWYGETVSQTLERSSIGDIRLVPQAESLMEQLDSKIETPRPVWTPSPAGAYAVVPEAIMGVPTSMRRRTFMQDEHTPIIIVACITSSGVINTQTLQKRGVTILALAIALARVRPISLYTMNILDGRDAGETVILSRINTSPLDLATSGYVLTSSGFSRRINYGLSYKLNGGIGAWPRNFNYGGPGAYFKDLVLRLGFDPKFTLMIEAARLHDELIGQPIAWINSQIAYFTQQNIEEQVA